MGCRSIREGVWHTFIAGLRLVERTKRKSVWRPCQAVCLYICLWSNISCSKSCWIFMKSGVVESAVSFFGFFVKSDVVEWGVSFFGFLWNPVLSNEASVSWTSAQSLTLIEGVNDFVSAVSVFLNWFAWKLGTENIHVISFNCCQFQGNRSVESHVLSVGVNAILLIFSTFYILFG
jgi:hypothetical protein